MLFGRSQTDAKLLDLALSSAQSLTSTQEESQALGRVAGRPLVSWYILRQIKQELDAAGIDYKGTAIDWDKIGDFIIKIAPILFELFKLFL